MSWSLKEAFNLVWDKLDDGVEKGADSAILRRTKAHQYKFCREVLTLFCRNMLEDVHEEELSAKVMLMIGPDMKKHAAAAGQKKTKKKNDRDEDGEVKSKKKVKIAVDAKKRSPKRSQTKSKKSE